MILKPLVEFYTTNTTAKRHSTTQLYITCYKFYKFYSH